MKTPPPPSAPPVLYPLTLRDAIFDDVGAVFLNLAEFGQELQFDGQTVTAVVDDSDRAVSLGANAGFGDTSGLGLAEHARVIYMAADGLASVPVPEQQVNIDGEWWLVEPGGVTREMGMLKILLSRAFS